MVFAFHGYQFAVHQLVHRRPDPARFHVRGFAEQGTTTTPFDMVVLNKMSRFHLAGARAPLLSLPADRVRDLTAQLTKCIDDAGSYAREHFEDPPEIRDWSWTSPRAP